MAIIIRKYMVSAYAKLVILGRYTIDESEVDGGKKLVPVSYHEPVSLWLAERNERLYLDG